MKLRVYDNGGKTADRYTVIVEVPNDEFGGEVYGMSDDANEPNGFNQFIGYPKDYEDLTEDNKRIRLVDLPQSTLVAIIRRLVDEE